MWKYYSQLSSESLVLMSSFAYHIQIHQVQIDHIRRRILYLIGASHKRLNIKMFETGFNNKWE
jgi:hypothetical protein